MNVGPRDYSIRSQISVVGVQSALPRRHTRLLPIGVECTLPEPELSGFITQLGPAGPAPQGKDERTRARKSSRPSVPPLIPLCTEPRFGTPPRAG